MTQGHGSLIWGPNGSNGQQKTGLKASQKPSYMAFIFYKCVNELTRSLMPPISITVLKNKYIYAISGSNCISIKGWLIAMRATICGPLSVLL